MAREAFPLKMRVFWLPPVRVKDWVGIVTRQRQGMTDSVCFFPGAGRLPFSLPGSAQRTVLGHH